MPLGVIGAPLYLAAGCDPPLLGGPVRSGQVMQSIVGLHKSMVPSAAARERDRERERVGLRRGQV